MEGLVVDKNVTLCDLKGTLEGFAKFIFGDDTVIRFRPSYFPAKSARRFPKAV